MPCASEVRTSLYQLGRETCFAEFVHRIHATEAATHYEHFGVDVVSAIARNAVDGTHFDSHRVCCVNLTGLSSRDLDTYNNVSGILNTDMASLTSWGMPQPRQCLGCSAHDSVRRAMALRPHQQ
jgi:hypothetical protein